jgi:hypothetical protein
MASSIAASDPRTTFDQQAYLESVMTTHHVAPASSCAAFVAWKGMEAL